MTDITSARLDKPRRPPYTPPVTRLLLAILLSLPLGARAASHDGGDAPGRAAGRARRLLENLPVDTRAELRTMYRRYAELVSARLEQGWRPGLLDEAVIVGENEGEEPFQPARLVEDMIRARRSEIRELEGTLKRTSPDKELPYYNQVRRAIQDKTLDLNALRAKAAREKGLCRDWSDAVWHMLVESELVNWTARDAVRSARPFHSGAVVCATSQDGELCLVFDPWAEGKAEVYAFEAWDRGQLGGRFPRDYMLHDLPEKK